MWTGFSYSCSSIMNNEDHCHQGIWTIGPFHTLAMLCKGVLRCSCYCFFHLSSKFKSVFLNLQNVSSNLGKLMNEKKYNDGNCLWLWMLMWDKMIIDVLTNENIHAPQLLMCEYDCYTGRLDETIVCGCVKMITCVLGLDIILSSVLFRADILKAVVIHILICKTKFECQDQDLYVDDCKHFRKYLRRGKNDGKYHWSCVCLLELLTPNC